jgi:GNAT superfamily N-acetyltransferase
MPSATDVLALETIAYELWRAPEVEELNGWRLRFAHGLTGRANSVWPCGEGSLPLAEKLDLAERWYRAHLAPVLFQITDASRPPELDAALASRGYRVRSAPVSVQVADLGAVHERSHGQAELSETLTDDWVARYGQSRGFGRLDVARALLASGRCAFARIGEVAVGRAAAVGEWLGITSMTTAPEARRRGHARAILHALAGWGLGQGCTHALLQVEHGNEAAQELYAGVGFAPHHDYHYRLLR